ncbi:phospholipase D family protein [Noviherbaspirillum sp.]|uniref:phospholipase D family nuclease n=1 Tax=Noviherbaspirillum sp. TaxID=1926288 RepID=UPI002B48BE21|nr:phospholipase D family protein [Noviherbaspirillum sp.]HJV82310.1 phospholipase D family protein [Noviherbaspirillum sp.]
MRRLVHAVGAIILLASAAATACCTDVPVFQAQGTWQAAFTPWDDIEGLVVNTIDGARKQVLVQAYLLTSKKIATTLVSAHRRGIDVRVLVDADQLERTASSAAAPILAEAGIPVWLETKYQNAHNKVIVIDPEGPNATVITGSFNFTWTAQHKNAENVLIARKNPVLAARYAQNWERHRQDATPYKR